MPRAEADRGWHSGLLTSPLAVGPFLGQVEPEIDQRLFAARNVAEIDTDLAVVDLAEPTAPLPLHAHRLRPLLGKGRRVENQDAIGFAQLRAHLPHQFSQQRLVIPLRLADEFLQTLPFPVVQISNRFHILAVQVRQQSLDVVPGVGLSLRRLQDRDEGLQKGFQPGQHAAQQAGADLSIVEQFVQPNSKSSFHRYSPFSGFHPLKGAYTPRTYGRSRRETQQNYRGRDYL